MAIQRVRILPGSETPQRNVVRTSQTEFNEGQSPSALTPISPVTVPGGSIRMDGSPIRQSYLHIEHGDAGGGLKWKKTDVDGLVAKVDGDYIPFSATRDITELFLSAQELSGDLYGDAVGRSAGVQIFLEKNPSNPSAVTDDNQGLVLLNTQMNSAASPAQLVVVAKNDGRTVLIVTDDFKVQTPAFIESYLRHLGGPGSLGTTDASGFLTITHNAGFTPKAVQMIKCDTLGNPDWWQAGTDSYTSTTFQARFTDAGGTVLNTRAVSGAFICYK